jgi:hypothetical protein
VLPYLSCLTTHCSGWPQHTDERLILRATAKFDNVRQNQLRYMSSQQVQNMIAKAFSSAILVATGILLCYPSWAGEYVKGHPTSACSSVVEEAEQGVKEYWFMMSCTRDERPWKQKLLGVRPVSPEAIYIPNQVLVNGVDIGGYFCSIDKIPQSLAVAWCYKHGWDIPRQNRM